VPFGLKEPAFGLDIGFYIFALPLLEELRDLFLMILVLTAGLTAAVYWARGSLDWAAVRLLDEIKRAGAPASEEAGSPAQSQQQVAPSESVAADATDSVQEAADGRAAGGGRREYRYERRCRGAVNNEFAKRTQFDRDMFIGGLHRDCVSSFTSLSRELNHMTELCLIK